MLIDWFTVGAQVLNFVILAWLMKRFLYKPILDAIDAREKRIATELAAASRSKTEARQERDALQKKNEDFDQQRDALLHKATADADAQRKTLMDAARQAADEWAGKRQTAQAKAAQALAQTLRQRAQTEVFAIARQALTDLAGASLEARACEAFIARLQAVDGQARDDLVTALGSSGDPVVVRSAFELPKAQQHALHQALVDHLGVKLKLSFETQPALVAGIELIAKGQKFSWNLNEHLDALQRSVADLLKAPATAT